MSNQREIGSLRIELRLEGEAEPIAGTLDGDGPTRSFSGWIELIGAIAAARRSQLAARQDGHPTSRRG